MDQAYMTTFMRPVPPTDMQLVLHKGGWQVSVSPTLVELNLTAGRSFLKVKTTNLTKHHCGFDV